MSYAERLALATEVTADVMLTEFTPYSPDVEAGWIMTHWALCFMATEEA
jgi:hypothetical protein